MAKPSKLPGDKEGPGLELPGDKEFRPFSGLCLSPVGETESLALVAKPSKLPGDKEGLGL